MQSHPASTMPSFMAPIPPTAIAEYAAVPIDFEVSHRVVVDRREPLAPSLPADAAVLCGTLPDGWRA
jgi:hypothetical protein